MDTYHSSNEHGTSAGQSGFAGNLWEQNEVNNNQWLFSVGLAGWPAGLQGRPGQWCTILIDSGSSATVCGPQHFPDYPIVPSECLTLYEPSGKPLRHYGQKDVNFFAEDGQKVTIKFDVANVVRPIVGVGKLEKSGKEVVLGKKSYIKERRGRRGVRRLGFTRDFDGVVMMVARHLQDTCFVNTPARLFLSVRQLFFGTRDLSSAS